MEMKQIDKEILLAYYLLDVAIEREYISCSDNEPFVTEKGQVLAQECLEEGIFPPDKILGFLVHEVLELDQPEVVHLLQMLRSELCGKPE